LEWLGSGIRLDFNSNDNAVYKNNIANNRHGIDLDLSSNNRVYDNNFINNSKQVSSFESTNAWDNGYPSGGNYWDDYDKLDTDGDGIGDTPYVIDADEQDRYPRVVPLGPIPVVWNEQFYPIELKSNSTIYRFRFYPSQKMIRFNVTGPDVTLGFCNLTLPNSLVQDLWQGSFAILVDGEQPITMNNGTDGTHMYIYITYLHSTHEVEIILEFPTGTSLLLILTVLSVAIILQKTAHNDKRATFAKRGRSWSAARWPVPKLILNCSDSCFLVW
jgi:parallel beta-helix repeat protein